MIKYSKKEFETGDELNSAINSDDNYNDVNHKGEFSTPDMTPRKPENSKTSTSDFSLQDSPTPTCDVFSSFNKSSNNNFFNSLQRQENTENDDENFNSFDSLNPGWSENEPSSSSLVRKISFSEDPKNVDCVSDQDSILSNNEEKEDKVDHLLLSIILCALIAVLSFVIYLVFFGSSDKKEEENL